MEWKSRVLYNLNIRISVLGGQYKAKAYADARAESPLANEILLANVDEVNTLLNKGSLYSHYKIIKCNRLFYNIRPEFTLPCPYDPYQLW